MTSRLDNSPSSGIEISSKSVDSFIIFLGFSPLEEELVEDETTEFVEQVREGKGFVCEISYDLELFGDLIFVDFN